MKKTLSFVLFSLLLSFSTVAQNKKFWVSGAARGTIFIDQYLPRIEDTITPRKSAYGHTLVDLNANIKPNDVTFIKAGVRIRNEYGGFWGGGITFDLRELYVKGLIARSIRYQLGDMYYRLTPFTFYNHDEELYENTLDIFRIYREMIHYDLFYRDDHSWRQQGIATDFALTFKKWAKEMQFNLFASRLNPTNFNDISERVFAGGNLTLIQSRFLTLGMNYIQLMDIEGTSNNTNLFRNPVVTGNYVLSYRINRFLFKLKGESGKSSWYIKGDTSSPELKDYFNYASASVDYLPQKISFSISFRDVGPGFRSTGAQMKRFNFTSLPVNYTRYTSGQVLRPVGMWDFFNDVSLYNIKIAAGLQEFNPLYDDIEPYGLATPNRKGLDFCLNRKSIKDVYEFNLAYSMLSEIAGQGTISLKKFRQWKAHVKFHLQHLIPGYNRKIFIEAGMANGIVNRHGSESYESIDLKSMRFNAGFTLELFKDFELMGGWESYSVSGNEFIPLRNEYTEVVDFSEIHAELAEKIVGLGVRYNFSEKNTFQAIWSKYTWEDSKASNPPYAFSSFHIIYNMKF